MPLVQIPVDSLHQFGLTTAGLVNVDTAKGLCAALRIFLEDLNGVADVVIDLEPRNRLRSSSEQLEYRVSSMSGMPELEECMGGVTNAIPRSMVLSCHVDGRLMARVEVCARHDDEGLSESVIALLAAIAPHVHRAIKRLNFASTLLSVRESEVASLVACGMSDREIGRQLGISFSTVRTHINNVLGRLDCANRTEVAALILEQKLSLHSERTNRAA